MYYKRDICDKIRQLLTIYDCVLLTGSRQVGKSTLLINEFNDFTFNTLDNSNVYMALNDDPVTFLFGGTDKFILDEVQRLQKIFLNLKYFIDENKRKGISKKVILTGSQKYELMKNISESLAGRIAIVEMAGLSNREIYSFHNYKEPFMPIEKYFNNVKIKNSISNDELWARILKGSYPEIYDKGINNVRDFYANIVTTYVERDVKQIIHIKDELQFTQFIVALAVRTGQILNYDELAKIVGVDNKTIKNWISVLLALDIIYLLEPFSLNVTKRIIKSSKIYFMDTGLASYLSGWFTKETLMNGASSGQIYETFVIGEIIKSYRNMGIKPNIYYYRDTNQNEIDLLIYENNTLYPIEIKKTMSPNINDIKCFKLLSAAYPTVEIGKGCLICNSKDFMKLNENNYLVPVEYI